MFFGKYILDLLGDRGMKSPPVASKTSFLTPLAEVNKAVKTSNSNLSAYIGTVRFELRSKSKRFK